MARVKFGDVVKEVKVNVDRVTDTHEFYIAGEHMDSNNIHLTRRGRFAGSDVGPAFIRLFQPGQILYGSRRTYLKKVAVADFEGITSNTTFVLESKDETVLLQGLLPFIMLSDSFTEYAIKYSKGSTNPYILFRDLAEYEFDLPDMPSQEKLLAHLQACDAVKEAYKNLIQKTDEMVKSQFIEVVNHAKSDDALLKHVHVLYGFPFNSKLFNTTGEGMPLLRIRDINTGISDTFTTEIADEKYIVHNKDCLVGMDGSFEIVKWMHGEAYLNQRMCKFIPIDVQQEYMLYYLRFKLKELEATANSTTVKHLSAKNIKEMRIPLADLAVQKEFQDFALQADKSQFIEMFGDPLFASTSNRSLRLKDACIAIRGGGTPSKNHPEYYTGSIPWVTPKDMKTETITDSLDHITEEAVSSSTTNLIPRDCVLMVIRSGVLKHTLPVAINKVPVTINQDMKAFIPGEKITAAYLLYYFKAIEQDVLSGVRSVTADNIDFKAFQERQIIVPPIEDQKRFATIAQQADKSKFAFAELWKTLKL